VSQSGILPITPIPGRTSRLLTALSNTANGLAQTVHALTRRAGISQPAVSKHLLILKRARLVGHRHEGRETHCSARPQALAPLVDCMALYGAFWRNRFDRREALLERMDP
jgi:DNA-binding transcriptional ArsR family regulator